jgi:hypothetical protein
MKLFSRLIFLFLAGICSHVFGQDIPVSRTVNWKLAGIHDSNFTPGITVDFLKAGGVADGLTDNSELFDSILNSMQGQPAIIYFPKGRYLFSRSLELQDGVTLKGYSEDSAELDFNLQKEDHLIKIEGKASGKLYGIKADVLKDSMRLYSDFSEQFTPGQYIRITDNDSAFITSSWAKRSTGQIVKIDRIDSVSLYLASPLRRNYSANSATIELMNPVRHCVIENLGIHRIDSTVAQTSNIFMEYAADCQVKCVRSLNCNFAHAELDNCTNIEVSGCYFHKAFNYGDGGKGYGIVAQFNTGECLVTNNNFDSLRHSMLVQAGANGNVFSYNYSKDPFWVEKGYPADASGDIALHGNYAYANLFEGNIVQNIVIDNSHGRNGPFNTFFRNRAELYGINMSFGAGDMQNLVMNEITNEGSFLGSFFITGINHFEYGNNKNGTIIPSGTIKPVSSSLYLNQEPGYYTTAASSWPPIGFPNKLNQYSIQARDYQLKGFFTTCSFKAPPADTTKQDTTKKDTTSHSAVRYYNSNPGKIISVFPNPTHGKVMITLQNDRSVIITNIIVYSSIGQQVIMREQGGEIDLSANPDGLYLVSIRMSDNTSCNARVIKVGR